MPLSGAGAGSLVPRGPPREPEVEPPVVEAEAVEVVPAVEASGPEEPAGVPEPPLLRPPPLPRTMPEPPIRASVWPAMLAIRPTVTRGEIPLAAAKGTVATTRSVWPVSTVTSLPGSKR